jgi:hypothetical protein
MMAQHQPWFALLVLLCGSILALAVPAAVADSPLPRDKGLPVIVQTGVAFIDLLGFDENAGTFKATIDVRLRWEDSRLRAAGASTTAPPQTLRDGEAEARMATMWVPPLVIANQRGEAAASAYGLRLYPDGKVELLHRITADFGVDIDVGRFPFDHQFLTVEAKVKGVPIGQLALRFGQSELDFSRPARQAAITGWTLGLVDLKSAPIAGWYNSGEARVVASLEVVRQPGLIVASIFIPLLASLFIPLLAIWLNRLEDGVFQTETFELINIVIGGLFAVIALNFTIYSSFVVLANGDNTVNRLFALNYLTLAVALVVNVSMARFNVLGRLFGPYVQEQSYYVLMWLIPMFVLVTASTFILNAYM